MPVKAIGFDYIGVTAHLPKRDFWGGLSQIFEQPNRRVREVYRVYRHLLQLGTGSEKQLWEAVASGLGHPEKAHVAQEFAFCLPVPDAHMLALVDSLREHHKVGLLSNLSGEWATALYESDVIHHFDAVMLSSEIGYCKPALDAYQALVSALGVRLDELIFIDDRSEATKGITTHGVSVILADSAQKVASELNRRFTIHTEYSQCLT